MGCSSSKSLHAGSDMHDGSCNVFKVIILNTRGHDCALGRMEVTPHELILHQLGKPPICWPLAGLRHYGFNEDLFSFESGRRCPTGEGIYAFRCNRAESLFNVLQERILQAADQSNNRLAAHQASLLSRFHSETIGAPDSRILRPNNHNMYVNTTHDYENRPPPPMDALLLLNGSRNNEDIPPLSYADLDLEVKQAEVEPNPPFCSNCDPTCNGNAPHCPPSAGSKKRSAYMNVLYENLCSDDHHVDPAMTGQAKRRSLSASLKTCYVSRSGLIGKLMDKGKDDTQSMGSCRVESRRASRRSSGASNCGREHAAVGYASIDFDRTHALNSSRHGSAADDNDGMRKTRHSVSTAEDVDP